MFCEIEADAVSCRSADTSQHAISEDPTDDGGKRVRKDPAQLSQTLSTAGQQVRP